MAQKTPRGLLVALGMLVIAAVMLAVAAVIDNTALAVAAVFVVVIGCGIGMTWRDDE